MRIQGGIMFFGMMGQSEADIYKTPHVSRGVPAMPTLPARPRRRTAAATLLALALLGGCAADPEPDSSADSPAPAAGDPAPPSPADPGASSQEEAPADEREETPGAIGGAEWTAADTNEERQVTGVALLREMRTARHEEFDRVVLDFGDDDVPGYRISYIDRPVRQCGSGNEVPIAGDGWLSITVEPANAHTEAGVATVRDRERTPRLPVVLELEMICDFEAVVEVVAGVASPERYRVFVLPSPNRLVVDILHPR